MKRLLLICILFCSLFAQAQRGQEHVTRLTRDSITYNFDENWRFLPGDDTAYAQPGYDDSKWGIRNPRLSYRPDKENTFKGIGWLRLHINVDSTLTNRPLALSLTHTGASEVYLDGKRIKKYGVIHPVKDSCEYYDPQRTPFLIMIPEPGAHVIAVRYANYDAARNYKVYAHSSPGFRMSIYEGNGVIQNTVDQATATVFIFTLLFGIFIALSLVHMLLYLYYRAASSNLYFSIFSFALSFVFLSGVITRVTSDPSWELNTGAGLLFSGILACFSLSGFINVLFVKKRITFYIITAFCIAIVVIWFFEPLLAVYGVFFMVGLVSLEAIVLTVYGIYKKVKGARIIAVGILFVTLFMLVMFLAALMSADMDLNDSTTSGQITLVILGLAILSLPISMSAYLAWNFATVSKHLKAQLEQVKLLSDKALEQEHEKKKMLENRKEELEKEVLMRTAEIVLQKEKIEKQHDELKSEKKKSDDLLRNILPEEIAEELKEKGSSDAKYFDHVSVLFTDFVAFTKAGERMTPQELVNELHTCFKAFDEICSKYNIEKIKTIGDAYLAVCGLPVADADHAEHTVKAAQEILQFMTDRKKQVGDKTFEIRIGIHSGAVVAGIVGVKKFAYDIWGDTVNTAARMEQNSIAGKINISETTFDKVKDRFDCTYRGQITAKNKGELKMYFVEKAL